MDSFSHGPFVFEPRERIKLAGKPARKWELFYASESLGCRAILDDSTRDAIIDACSDLRSAFVVSRRSKLFPEQVFLIDNDGKGAAASFNSFSMCGMTPGLIDDRSRYWLRSADKLHSRNVTLSEFAQIAAEHSAPANAWITGLLPDDILTADPSGWRAPTAWEIRHVVGEGSFTQISGAKAAQLVGVTPQNFRKYTASDDATTRQKMSFAMWHLLLHKLGVQRA